MTSYPLLETIDDPAQLRALDRRALHQLATELRGFIVESVEGVAAAFGRVGDLDPRVLRARVQERFSDEAMVTGYERVYERALHGERTGAA